jgi:serine/threonine protein phosphatase PrpC
VVDGFTAGHFIVRAASVRGDSHRHYGDPRQDAVTAALLGTAEQGVVLGVVADGVSAAQFSHHGAAIACAATVDALNSRVDAIELALNDGDEDRIRFEVVHALDEIAGRIIADAARLDTEPASLSTTIRAVLLPTSGSPWRASFSVGDGGTYRLRRGVWHAITGETVQSAPIIHSTAVHALPEQKFALRCRLWQAEANEVIAVCTDGLSQPLKDSQFADYLSDVWSSSEVPGTIRFLWQIQSRLRTYDDDRAVVCIWEFGTPSPPE